MHKHRINLISDTVTLPTKNMLEFMVQAKLGDDVFKEDPTVSELENRLANMFNQEAGLFCPSGTMANQIAIKGHTNPLDELICDINSHVFQYEVSGYAFHSGISINPLVGDFGKLSGALIEKAIKPDQDWLPNTKLVVIENTGNRSGGNYYSLNEIQEVSAICRKRNLKLHLDGARIFNAILAANYSPSDIGNFFDSISICLSKGLGAPVGSVLIGSREWIQKCRKIRKVMGGGMRQAGILAAAGLYALDHHLGRLQTDHDHAAQLEQCLSKLTYVDRIRKVYTNIVIFDLTNEITPENFLKQLMVFGINASAFGNQSIRFVTHLDFTKEMLFEVEDVLKNKIVY
ncbi:MAG: PLP-dependent transferase [Saprospiraceae bacterium]|nr:PLP-dependent transferase [Saprospiraceae bacterium]MBK9221474.1 PLP-dependent transferase [Saprospiraceae bacterium]MBK9721588.1 PLP-dependent transferase [Saprospiraceae bacterium]